MSKTIEQVLNSASDPVQALDCMRLIGFGSMMCGKSFQIAVPGNAPVFKLSDLSQPRLRVGAIFKESANLSQNILKNSQAFADDVPAAGLTVGAGNAAVTVVPKAGWRVRYVQFNPGGPADTGNYFNATYSLKVFASIWGDVLEIWVALGNDATATITSFASDVVAAIKANADAMQGLASVSFGGTGASAAVSSTGAAIQQNRPSVLSAIAAGMGVYPQLGFGSIVSSMDGNICFSIRNVGFYDVSGQVMPLVPLTMIYQSSAV